MYDKVMVDGWRAGKKFVLLAGYDADFNEKGYADLLPQPLDRTPTVRDADFLVDRYKPLEIRGSKRDNIWCELYDEHGKYDLNKWFINGVKSYIVKFDNV